MAGLTPPGHEVVLCDENVEPIDFDTDADLVGVTGFAVHKRRILEIVDAFRRRGKLMAAGGSFATLCPDELRDRVDVLFVGEAEYTWPRFLRDHTQGAWPAEYRQGDKPGMLGSPLPRFDLLKVKRYRSIAIEFAPGCPSSCEFCDIAPRPHRATAPRHRLRGRRVAAGGEPGGVEEGAEHARGHRHRRAPHSHLSKSDIAASVARPFWSAPLFRERAAGIAWTAR